METDARWNLDVLASIDTRAERDMADSPVSAFFWGLEEELFDRVRPIPPPARAWAPQGAGRASARQLRPRDPELVPTRATAPRRVKATLLVDPDISAAGAVRSALRAVADVDVCTDFRNARARLLDQPPDLLVTNLRLEAYNGLHLVHLAAGTRTRCIVFSTPDDLGFAREVRAAGAFFELAGRLPRVLESYVNATLPPRDRRDITSLDTPFRDGRRCTDR